MASEVSDGLSWGGVAIAGPSCESESQLDSPCESFGKVWEVTGDCPWKKWVLFEQTLPRGLLRTYKGIFWRRWDLSGTIFWRRCRFVMPTQELWLCYLPPKPSVPLPCSCKMLLGCSRGSKLRCGNKARPCLQENPVCTAWIRRCRWHAIERTT